MRSTSRNGKKGRSNPSGETTLAIMGIAEERTEGARTALSSADRFAKDFSFQLLHPVVLPMHLTGQPGIYQH
jgi:hypothetical protein